MRYFRAKQEIGQLEHVHDCTVVVFLVLLACTTTSSYTLEPQRRECQASIASKCFLLELCFSAFSDNFRLCERGTFSVIQGPCWPELNSVHTLQEYPWLNRCPSGHLFSHGYFSTHDCFCSFVAVTGTFVAVCTASAVTGSGSVNEC